MMHRFFPRKQQRVPFPLSVCLLAIGVGCLFHSLPQSLPIPPPLLTIRPPVLTPGKSETALNMMNLADNILTLDKKINLSSISTPILFSSLPLNTVFGRSRVAKRWQRQRQQQQPFLPSLPCPSASVCPSAQLCCV